MKLLIDTSRVQFTVTRAVGPKTDMEGKQRRERGTDALLWVVQVMALDENGGEMLMVTVAGEEPKLTVGQVVRPVELEAIPWNQNGRNGVAFRAKALAAQAAGKSAA
jgi:hypothetical protein